MDTEELIKRLASYRSFNEWGDPVQHTICDEAATALRLLTEEVEKLRTYAHEATVAITGLTVGGSEYFGKRIGEMYTADLPYCVTHIRERMGHRVDVFRAEAEVEKLKAELTTARDEWRIVLNQRAAAETEAASLRQKLEVAREALKPFAAFDVHYPQKWRYGNRPSSGAIMQVATHEHADAEMTVEHIHAARAALTTLDQPHA